MTSINTLCCLSTLNIPPELMEMIWQYFTISLLNNVYILHERTFVILEGGKTRFMRILMKRMNNLPHTDFSTVWTVTHGGRGNYHIYYEPTQQKIKSSWLNY